MSSGGEDCESEIDAADWLTPLRANNADQASHHNNNDNNLLPNSRMLANQGLNIQSQSATNSGGNQNHEVDAV